MKEDSIDKYALANTRMPYPPPPPHFRRRFSSTDSTLASVENSTALDAKMVVATERKGVEIINTMSTTSSTSQGGHKRKNEENRSFEERQLEPSTSKRRMMSIDEDGQGRDSDERMDSTSERRDNASPSPRVVESSQDREATEQAGGTAVESARATPPPAPPAVASTTTPSTTATIANAATPSAPPEVIDITASSNSKPQRRTSNSSGSGMDKSHREVKRVGSSELASAMALASLAFGKPDKSSFTQSSNSGNSGEGVGETATATATAQSSTSIHRPKQLMKKSISSSSSGTASNQMPPLSTFASPQQAQEYLLSRSMSTTSSGTSFGYPGMNDPRMSHYHPLYNHQRFNMNVPPEVFLANAQMSRPGAFPPVGAGAMGGGGGPPPPSQIQPKKKKWVCDYCNDASFDDYEEAVRHERTCSHNPKAIKITSSRGSVISTMSTIDEDERKAECMNRLKKYERRSFFDVGPIATRPDPEQKEKEKNIYFEGSIPLAVGATDSDWLSETNCYIRRECVEAFSATESDIMVSSKRGRISLYQVGIRCKFCAEEDTNKKASGAVSFPVSVSGIYESVKRWKSVHLPECKCIPEHVKEKIKSLEKTACVPTTRQYWIDSAKAVGIEDTQDGLRFVVDPAKSVLASKKKAEKVEISPEEGSSERSDEPPPKKEKKEEYIVFPEDKPTITPYVYCLMRQVQPCIFSEADRFLSRSKSKVGFAGFECRWCSGHAGLGRYFPSNPKALSTNSTSQNIYSHIQKCRKCPQEVKDELKTLKFEKPTWLRRTCGWRQAFFEKLWHRLHGVDGYDGLPYTE